jgi:hypothetical protein
VAQTSRTRRQPGHVCAPPWHKRRWAGGQSPLKRDQLGADPGSAQPRRRKRPGADSPAPGNEPVSIEVAEGMSAVATGQPRGRLPASTQTPRPPNSSARGDSGSVRPVAARASGRALCPLPGCENLRGAGKTGGCCGAHATKLRWAAARAGKLAPMPQPQPTSKKQQLAEQQRRTERHTRLEQALQEREAGARAAYRARR